MVREIEYRVWDKKNRKMIYTNPYDSSHKWMTWNGLSYENGVLLNYIFLQYTGLRDKNGKKIYEGDIVHSVHGEKGNIAGFVGYRAFEFVIFRGKRKQSWHSFGCVCGEEGGIYEVVGNIYENSKLVRGSK